MEPIVSIVIPVYNVEATLGRCIKSVVNQTYRNIEIILVDDGSQDKSGDICDKWKLCDDRIKVIHKANAGLGEARNTGIDNASGKYIMFCDSDDFMHASSVEKCVLFAEKNSADIVHFGFFWVDEELNVENELRAEEERVFRGEQIIKEFLPGISGGNRSLNKPFGSIMSLCAALISLDMIKNNNWKCESERKIISEDVYSLFVLYSHVKVAGVLPYALYYYVRNSNSLSRKYAPDRYQRIEQFYYVCVAKCRELGYGQDVERGIANSYIDFTIAAIKQVSDADVDFFKKMKAIKGIANSELLQKLFANDNRYAFSKRLFMLSMRKRLTFLSFMLCRLKSRVS
ncbi:glycosyltransferase family 2 protein [Butyrivibrio sp. FCS014]|uniref:glycosyltransferase family 2 protein n=1 Tax=Butyrivibrio sp. FCS014 TaxID=1408304 RepID=UPI000462EA08|nr:glycosyltransferase family 2 protein [Butyrivibrio sp. FCS014]